MWLSTELLLVAALLASVIYLYGSYHRELPLPPGPKSWPFIGNLRDMPSSYPWLKYTEWAKCYGEITHTNVLGTHVTYVNSPEAANELFNKRSSIYSGRPRMVMLGELMGWDWMLGAMPYGPIWRKHRRGFHQFFHMAATENYKPSQILEARKMLLRLINTPEDLFQHIRHTVVATITRILYGFELQSLGDPLVHLSESVLDRVALASNHGTFLVDIIPVLKYIPEWMPGASFRRLGNKWKSEVNSFRELPFLHTKSVIASGKTTNCVLAKMLCKENVHDETTEGIAKNVTGAAYAAGADTIVSTIQSFALAMVLNPEVQSKAHAELDHVIGKNRLPEFDDRPSLPYVEAIVREALRLHPVTPLGVAHMVEQDDEYKGYRIPKNSVVLANIWSMLHDENIYPDPLEFKPERFLDECGQLEPSVPPPETFCFGFGRRICPGRHFATNGAWISIASMLAALQFSHAVDSNGNTIPVKNEVTSGFLSHPVPFRCSIKPRTDSSVDMIQSLLGIELE